MALNALVVDDEKDLAEVIGFLIESQFQANVEICWSGNQAIQLLEKKKDFDFIVSDYSMDDGTGEELFVFMKENKIDIPFVLCSAYHPSNYEAFKKNQLSGFVTKPDVFDPLADVIRNILVSKDKKFQENEKEYCHIKTDVILKIGSLSCDVFMKTGDNQFAQVFSKGKLIPAEAGNRFKSKAIDHLYIRKSDCAAFLRQLESVLMKFSKSVTQSLMTEFDIAESTVEIISEFTSQLGFSGRVQLVARQGVEMATKAIDESQPISDLFSKPPFSKERYLHSHSAALAFLANSIASEMGIHSKQTLKNLSLAAFLHDLTLQDNDLAQLQTEPDLLMHESEHDPTTLESVLQHPTSAAETVKDVFDPEVSELIAQHHERPDGSGFPKKLDHSKISQLSALFIVSHELLSFMFQNGWKVNLHDFVSELNPAYSKGHFKEVVEAVVRTVSPLKKIA